MYSIGQEIINNLPSCESHELYIIEQHGQVCHSKTPPSWYQFVLVGVAIAAIKHHDQKQLGEERVYFAHVQFHIIVHHQKQ